MKKLKLNIQYFGSTNHTQYYNLSQYIANDKPTYLVDYNGDMLKIDNALYSVNQKSLENESAIGTLSDLTTTNKSSLVNALNEVNSQVGTNTSNISQNTLDISANTTAIGTLADLSTTNKSNLVNAVNELKSVNDTQTQNISQNTLDIANIENNLALNNVVNLSMSNATTTGIDTSTIDEVDGVPIKLAHNDNYSLFKIYGILDFTVNAFVSTITFSNVIPTAYRPSSDITINPAGLYFGGGSPLSRCSVTIKANGDIFINCVNQGNTGTRYLYLLPCLYFLADFGDSPVNP